MLTRRGLIVAYLNLLIVTAIVTLAVGTYVRQQNVESQKRQLYVDMLGVRCDTEIEDNPDYCGYGDCKPLNIDDTEGPHICYCWVGYTSYLQVCDLQKIPQFKYAELYLFIHLSSAFMSSFFGGWVGADWFYLFRFVFFVNCLTPKNRNLWWLHRRWCFQAFDWRRFLHLVGHRLVPCPHPYLP